MQSQDYISKQPAERQELLNKLHEIIIQNDLTVIPVVEPMMGKEMIIYKDRGMMKYALSGVIKYMSLHVLPIYGAPVLHDKYKTLLDKASFQKGCINFENAEQMPLDIVKQLITDCAKIDLVKIREDYLKKKKEDKKKK